MDANKYYNFDMLFARIKWLSPTTIRHYVSFGKFSFQREYDVDGTPMFNKLDVENWIQDHRPRRPRTKKHKRTC